jgi:hypothetical protein
LRDIKSLLKLLELNGQNEIRVVHGGASHRAHLVQLHCRLAGLPENEAAPMASGRGNSGEMPG